MNDNKENPSVCCLGLVKTYGQGEAKVEALRGADLVARYGELLMISGPSGCGKTTLISVITALLDPDGGSCSVLGRDAQAMSPTARAQFRGTSIGFVFQVFNLLPALTAVENVSVPLLLMGCPKSEAEERARDAIQSVGLGDRMEMRPTHLSGGQQQRVAIARALVHNPALIVCDEPTSNLDHKSGEAMMEILCDRARSPERTVIVVTHDPRIYRFADRIARMDDGKIIDILEGKEKERLL